MKVGVSKFLVRALECAREITASEINPTRREVILSMKEGLRPVHLGFDIIKELPTSLQEELRSMTPDKSAGQEARSYANREVQLEVRE